MVQEVGRTNNEKSSAGMNIRWGRIITWLGLATLLGILFLGLYNTQKGQIKVGDKAPDFTLKTFDGNGYRSSELAGKVILVNIWASWCKPCEQEASYIEAAWRYYQPRGDVIFLGVAWTDTDKNSKEYLDKFEITYPNGPDLGMRIYQAFRATGVPETYVVDRQGILAYTRFSPFTSLNEIKAAIDPLLNK